MLVQKKEKEEETLCEVTKTTLAMGTAQLMLLEAKAAQSACSGQPSRCLA